MNKKISLNFFGYVISISSNNDYIISQIKYIYKHYLTKYKSSDICYYFEILDYGSQKYLVSELINSKEIIVYHGVDLNNMDIWQSETTFLPPITATYFSQDFSFFHGCSIRYQDETIVFIGDSRSGKTTLSMNYLNHGAQLISDDLLIVYNKDLSILPFKKPIGLRKTSPIFFEDKVQKAINNKPSFISTFYVKSIDLTSELIHAEEIEGWKYFEQKSKIDKIYFLSDNKNEKINGHIFLKNMLNVSYQSISPIKIISGIYNNLSYTPEYIPLHYREII